jgi:hypothetical protein
MRYVSSIPPAATSPNTRQVTGLAASQAVSPVHAHVLPPTYVEQHSVKVNPDPVPHTFVPKQEIVPTEERRKACRRLLHQAVLIELRSGIDRRHHNLREGDVAEHIDIEA